MNEYHLMMADVVSEAWTNKECDVPDGISFAWWNDEQLHDFIKVPSNITALDEDNLEALTEEVARRVDAKLKEWERSHE